MKKTTLLIFSLLTANIALAQNTIENEKILSLIWKKVVEQKATNDYEKWYSDKLKLSFMDCAVMMGKSENISKSQRQFLNNLYFKVGSHTLLNETQCKDLAYGQATKPSCYLANSPRELPFKSSNIYPKDYGVVSSQFQNGTTGLAPLYCNMIDNNYQLKQFWAAPAKLYWIMEPTNKNVIVNRDNRNIFMGTISAEVSGLPTKSIIFSTVIEK